MINLNKYDQSWYIKGKNAIIILVWWFIQATLFKCSLHSMYHYRNTILRIFGCKIGNNVKIRSTAKFHYPWKITIGNNSWIGDEAILYSLDEIIIGDNCVVSQYAHLCTGSHDIESESFNLIIKPIVIEDSAWVATDVFVGQGVTIKEGSVIAARSSIYKDSEPWMVHIGNPAKAVRERVISKE